MDYVSMHESLGYLSEVDSSIDEYLVDTSKDPQ